MTHFESKLKFNFSEKDWSFLLKLDETKDFRKANRAIPGTKGVDFVGIYEEDSLVLIEVKNFRQHRIENKAKTEGRDGLLWLEIAQKIRDSFSVIVGGARNSTNKRIYWRNYLDFIRDEKKAVHLVLWLEQSLPPAQPKAQKKRGRSNTDLKRNLKKSLRWLSSKVDIASIENNPFPNSLTVNFQ